MTAPILLAQNVHKAFGRNEVMKGIDLQVAKGEVMCILGPSGSGKSTFLRCINHLEHTDRGDPCSTTIKITWAASGFCATSPIRFVRSGRRSIGGPCCTPSPRPPVNC